MRVLITGGTGFIGTNLVKTLNNATEISIIKQPNSIIPSWSRSVFKKTKIYDVDICNLERLQEIIKNIEPEKIFHLAAYTTSGQTFIDANKSIQINIQGTANILHSLENTDYECFVNMSTSEVYGNNATPFKEDQRPNPVSPYGISKYTTEMFCNILYKVHGYPILNLRLFNPYGEFQPPNKIISKTIISCLLKKDIQLVEGEITRDFIYIQDVVNALIKSSETKKAIGETINIGSGKEHSIKDIVTRIINSMDNPIKPLFGVIPYRKNEIMHNYADVTKTRKILNWKPKHTLNSGLKKTIEWYKDQFKKEPKSFIL